LPPATADFELLQPLLAITMRGSMIPPDKSWTRRDFLKLAGQAGLVTAFAPLTNAGVTDADTVTISILHTTDLHGHILPTFDYNGNPDLGGFARCATQIRRWRRRNPNSILIDVGDVYQGTDVSFQNKGELMIDLFNHLKYDAWIVGNHEFDWGIEVFLGALTKSAMPILAANTSIEGKAAGEFVDAKDPLAKIQPFIVKEFDKIKVAIIGVTTPGMPFWFRPEFTGGVEFDFPIEPTRRAIAKAKEQDVNAIVLAGHMGFKPRTGGDDFANSVTALTTEFPEVAVFIAGHTHQLLPSCRTNHTLLTQADHFGIYVGRVDLVFDRVSKKLLSRQTQCELMDSKVRLDHVVLSRAKAQLDLSEAALNEPIGEVVKALHARGRPGIPSDVEGLIGMAISEALQLRGAAVDGVFHGVFDESAVVSAGPKTVNDVWNIVPYENYIVTAELTPDEIKAIMEEAYASHEERNLLGFRITVQGRDYRIVTLTLASGQQLERGKRYKIAFNTFDSRSGGHRFMKLRTILERPESNCTFQPVQTRDALIDYFRRHRTVRKVACAECIPIAA
jgi:5'-nucleotidase / UDP-sugar diphosphatase